MAAALAVTGTTTSTVASAAEPATPPGPAPVQWQPCGTGPAGTAIDCATVTVPVDHDDPAGATIALDLVRRPATDPANRIGSLLVNPGGPGGSAVDFAVNVALGPDVTARYDIVGVDPRGVGESTEVRCFTDAEREEFLTLDYDPTIPGGAPADELDALALEIADACAAGVDPHLLANLDTEDVVRDMDLVRAALGEEQISYFGLSYGTLIGAMYASLFPERVRHMVLDAPVDPQTWLSDPLGATADQQISAEAVLDLYFETCTAEGEACPFGGDAPAAAFDALVTRLEAEPLVVPAANGLPEGRVDGASVLGAARLAAFDRRFWPVLTAGLLAAENGDGSIINALSAGLLRDPDGTPNGLGEVLTAVMCVDRNVPRDRAAHERTAEEIIAEAPRFGNISSYLLLACRSWPVSPDVYDGPLAGAGAPPILVVGGRIDSQTPYPWAESMADTLESGVLLTREGIGHGSYGNSGPCVDTAVEVFLTSGEAPADGTVCAQEPPATASPAALG